MFHQEIVLAPSTWAFIEVYECETHLTLTCAAALPRSHVCTGSLLVPSGQNFGRIISNSQAEERQLHKLNGAEESISHTKSVDHRITDHY